MFECIHTLYTWPYSTCIHVGPYGRLPAICDQTSSIVVRVLFHYSMYVCTVYWLML